MPELRHLLPPHLRRSLGRRWLLFKAGGFAKKKRITAMMRVKNEAAFLEHSVESIVGVVDEVVIVDNASADDTPRIVDALARRHPGKIRVHHYPHAIARVGAENHALIKTVEGRRSPNLLSNYYNWCLALCRTNFVLKWDGDMVASPAFSAQLAAFRRMPCLFMQLTGANLHPDRRHLVMAGAAREEEIQMRMTDRTTVGNWVSPYTDPEQRLFPRRGSAYSNDFWWCESLTTPYDRWFALTFYRPEDCSYLHLKYCKPNPFENFSSDFESLIRAGVVAGPDLPAALLPTAAAIFPNTLP